jgi:hypothetical protein
MNAVKTNTTKAAIKKSPGGIPKTLSTPTGTSPSGEVRGLRQVYLKSHSASWYRHPFWESHPQGLSPSIG